MIDPLPYLAPLLVRAEVVRIVGVKQQGRPVFRQKPLDARKFVAYRDRFRGELDWPGHAVPASWAETDEGWDVEPRLNGHAVLRCRRLELEPPVIGHKIGMARLSESSIVGTEDPERPWLHQEATDIRWLDLYEIVLPPAAGRTGRGQRSRIILAHPFDATVMPINAPTMDAHG